MLASTTTQLRVQIKYLPATSSLLVRMSSSSSSSSPVRVTNTPAIKNAPLVGLAEGNGSFNNLHLAAAVIVVPWLVKRALPIVNQGGFKTYLFLLIILGIPVTVGYWTLMSTIGGRKNTKVELPGRPITTYLEFNDQELKSKHTGTEKINMQVFHDAYFDGKVEVKGM